jgi:RNA polymerase sigma-70 factor (ECF subfamily)
MELYDGLIEHEFAAEMPESSILEYGESVAPAPKDFRRRVADELPFLRGAARRWHRERANIDDLVQDTVLQALANAHLWRPGSNLRGWLFTIMRNQFFAARIRQNRFELGVDEDLLDEFASVSAQAEGRLALRDVERALRRLPAPQQTAISLIALDGRSYDEAAGEMGLSVAAVRCHLARGRERLRSAVYGGAEVVPFRRPARRPEIAFQMIAVAAE